MDTSSYIRQVLHRRQFVVLLGGGLIILIAMFDLYQSKSIVHKHIYRPPYVFKYTPANASFHNTVAKQSEEDNCRVQFIFAGPKYDYKNYPTLESWVHYSNPKCEIDFVRSSHPFVEQLNHEEKHTLQDMKFLPVLQADFMKLLVLYYRSGVVTDMDVEALKEYPDKWVGPNTPLSTCDVILGIEIDCYDDVCAKGLVRKGQIQNWTMWARRRFTSFFGELLEYVVKKYKTFPPHDPNIAVQEVSGSGTITDFVNFYANFSLPHYEMTTTNEGGTLQTEPASILRIQKHNEEVCILGPSYSSGRCRENPECIVDHHYEGSWRSGTR